MNGDMVLLKLRMEPAMTLEEINQVRVEEPAKKIYSLTKLQDGRVCVSMDKGFSVWTMVTSGD